MKQAGSSCRGRSEVCRKEHVCAPRYITQVTKMPTETRSQPVIQPNLKRQSICVGSDSRVNPPTGPYNFDSGVLPGVVFGTVVPISNDDKSVQDAMFIIPWVCLSLDFV